MSIGGGLGGNAVCVLGGGAVGGARWPEGVVFHSYSSHMHVYGIKVQNYSFIHSLIYLFITLLTRECIMHNACTYRVPYNMI